MINDADVAKLYAEANALTDQEIASLGPRLALHPQANIILRAGIIEDRLFKSLVALTTKNNQKLHGMAKQDLSKHSDAAEFIHTQQRFHVLRQLNGQRLEFLISEMNETVRNIRYAQKHVIKGWELFFFGSGSSVVALNTPGIPAWEGVPPSEVRH